MMMESAALDDANHAILGGSDLIVARVRARTACAMMESVAPDDANHAILGGSDLIVMHAHVRTAFATKILLVMAIVGQVRAPWGIRVQIALRACKITFNRPRRHVQSAVV